MGIAPAFPNIHGRRPTRGLRPWLLVPKVIAVAAYLGGCVSLAVLCRQALHHHQARSRPLPDTTIHLIDALVRYVIDPAAILVTALGLLLLLQHPREFLRQRWLQVKLASLLLAAPAGKVFLEWRLANVRSEEGRWKLTYLSNLEDTVWGLIVLAAWVIVLGRLKPRFGQNWARDYPSKSAGEQGGGP